MSKYIYRTVILLLISIQINAKTIKEQEIEDVVSSIVSQYKGLENNETFKRSIKERYEYLTKTGNTQKSIDAVTKTLEKASTSLEEQKIYAQASKLVEPHNAKAQEMIKEYEEKMDFYKEKVDTIFYFYSESMPPIAMERFYETVKKLNEKFSNKLNAYVVLRGFPEKFQEFASRYKKESISGGKVKLHPLMYDYYDLQSVPAYAFARCPKDFKFKSCEDHMLVKGDISLRDALNYFSEEKSELKPYFRYLIEAQ